MSTNRPKIGDTVEADLGGWSAVGIITEIDEDFVATIDTGQGDIEAHIADCCVVDDDGEEAPWMFEDDERSP